MDNLTERQQREIDYHKDHAAQHVSDGPLSYDVLHRRRWWNGYWEFFYALRKLQPHGKRALVIGCGFGEDAVRLAKLGAQVSAFDLSPESINLAEALAKREGVSVDFSILPAETLSYPSNTFDLVVARDILHHVDIPPTVREMVRVSKPGALWVVNEMYSHSITEVVRRSWLVERVLYPAMVRFIYGTDKPYITEDERKMSERDMALVMQPLDVQSRRYFNFIVTRLIPDRFTVLEQADRLLMMALKPVSRFLAGRMLVVGAVSK